ncbi:Protein tyrosine phosphatase type IVA 2 [Dispira simplex]|nr:Protein tyrosine phosphatase type IVA 2 [Dispira simplex]
MAGPEDFPLLANAPVQRRPTLHNILCKARVPLVTFNRYLRFMITDCPTVSTLSTYLMHCQRVHVVDVVRACSLVYPADLVQRHGIEVHALSFDQDGFPTPQAVQYWLALVKRRAAQAEHEASSIPDAPKFRTISIHCVSGYSRAPLMVALALIKLTSMHPVTAVHHIQRKRPTALLHPDLLECVFRYGKDYGRSKPNLSLRSPVEVIRGLPKRLLTQCKVKCRISKRTFFPSLLNRNISGRTVYSQDFPYFTHTISEPSTAQASPIRNRFQLGSPASTFYSEEECISTNDKVHPNTFIHHVEPAVKSPALFAFRRFWNKVTCIF